MVEQRGQHRHHPLLLRQADVDVDSPDQHLPPPPLGAVDQLLVTVALGELLPRPRGERVRAPPYRSMPSSSATGTMVSSVSRSSATASPTVWLMPVTTSTVLRRAPCAAAPGCPAGAWRRRRARTPCCSGHGSSCRRARTPTRRRGSAPGSRESRSHPPSESHPVPDSIAGMLEARTLNLTMDFCLEVGEILLSSGAGPRTSPPPCRRVAWHYGVGTPTSTSRSRRCR